MSGRGDGTCRQKWDFTMWSLFQRGWWYGCAGGDGDIPSTTPCLAETKTISFYRMLKCVQKLAQRESHDQSETYQHTSFRRSFSFQYAWNNNWTINLTVAWWDWVDTVLQSKHVSLSSNIYSYLLLFGPRIHWELRGLPWALLSY